MSVFDLKTDLNELSSMNQGISKVSYAQIPASRDISTTNFASGNISYKFQTAATQWWVPNRSYLRLRATLSKANGTALDSTDDVAPSMGMMSNLFSSCEFQLGGKTVSRCSDYVAQISALETRQNKSKGWMDSVGATTDFWEPSFDKRKAEVNSDGLVLVGSNSEVSTPYLDGMNTVACSTAGVVTLDRAGGIDLVVGTFVVGDYIRVNDVDHKITSITTDTTALQVYATDNAVSLAAVSALVDKVVKSADGEASRRVKTFELIYQPPLSIFKLDHAIPPSCSMELILTPQNKSVIKQRIIESLSANKVAGTDYEFEITDMYLYNSMIDGPRMDNGSFLLDLEQTACQSSELTTTSLSQKTFDVSPATQALTVAFQDLRCDSDTRISASKFRVANAGVTSIADELKLNQLYLSYAGQQYPSPSAQPVFSVGMDYTTQMWVNSLIATGQYYSEGGAESLKDWHSRGSYYNFSTLRDGSDRSTRVTVYNSFESGANVASTRVLLFDHSKQVARVSIQDGRVTEVQLEDC